MLEIIAVIFLCMKNSKLAARKGLNTTNWVLATIGCWILFEVTGLLLGIFVLGVDNIIGLAALGLASGFGGYLFIRYRLEQMPDKIDDEISRIGEN